LISFPQLKTIEKHHRLFPKYEVYAKVDSDKKGEKEREAKKENKKNRQFSITR
jgi:hypothetical protein